MRKDKKLHLIVGVAVAAIVMLFTANAYYAFGAAVIAGIGKEIYDFFHRDVHTPDVFDALYTILGGILGMLGMYFLMNM